MEQNQKYERMKGMCGEDVYPDADPEQQLVSKVVPSQHGGSGSKAFNVTAAFYGERYNLDCWSKKPIKARADSTEQRLALSGYSNPGDPGRSLPKYKISVIFPS